jgi:hypothetical protein
MPQSGLYNIDHLSQDGEDRRARRGSPKPALALTDPRLVGIERPLAWKKCRTAIETAGEDAVDSARV